MNNIWSDGAHFWPENRTIQIHDHTKRSDGDLEAGDCWCHADCYNSQLKRHKNFPEKSQELPTLLARPKNYIKGAVIMIFRFLGKLLVLSILS